MKILSYLSFLFIFLVGCNTGGAQIGDVVQINSGKITGTIDNETGIASFKGIPFAQPPVGELRWKAPQPVENWEGIRECTAFGPSPMQQKPTPFMFWSSEFLIPEEPISEDCLYLNVWTGAEKVDEDRPVLVYIYGGGFQSGGSGCAIYDGAAMAEKGVVFVSINYRVGVFGFFAHPELSEEAEYGSSGNYALLDMIAALQWVKDNIQNFGGDPSNVTIAGQSAGSFAVNYLTASPLAKGLFQRAIAESGASFYSSPIRSSITMDTAEQQGVAYAKSLNCNSLEELRAKSSTEILNAQGGLRSPVTDGYVIKESIYDTYKKGQQNDVPVIAGWNNDDILFMRPMKAEDFINRMSERFGENSDAFFEAYPAGSDEESAKSQSAMSRDETFGIQMYAWAKMQNKTGQSKIYVYNFDRKLPANSPETQFGAFHSSEIVYAYNNLHTLDRPWEDIDYDIADVMSSYWANFAKNGDPNGEGLPAWPSFTPEDEEVMIFDVNTHAEPLPAKKQLAFWEMYYNK